MKKIIMLTVGLLFLASASYAAYPVDVTLDPNGAHTVTGIIKDTAEHQITGEEVLTVTVYTTSVDSVLGVQIYAKDSDGEVFNGVYWWADNPSLAELALSVTDTSKITAEIETGGVLKSLSVTKSSENL